MVLRLQQIVVQAKQQNFAAIHLQEFGWGQKSFQRIWIIIKKLLVKWIMLPQTALRPRKSTLGPIFGRWSMLQADSNVF